MMSQDAPPLVEPPDNGSDWDDQYEGWAASVFGPSPAPSAEPGRSSFAMLLVGGVGTVALVGAGVKTVVARRYQGKEAYLAPSWRNLWIERRYEELSRNDHVAAQC